MNGGNYNGDNRGDGNNPYNIFDGKGRPKNIIWSVASVVAGLLSLSLSVFGWAGLVFGVTAIVFSIAARRTLGYFNGWAIAGLLLGIFGTVFSTSLIVIAYTNPALLVELLGFSSVPGAAPPAATNPTNSTGNL